MPGAFDNAIRVDLALGGSTNAIIHVIALARRAGITLDTARFDAISRQVPVIANITPSGKYLMEDFFYAGGLRALMAQIQGLLDLSSLTVTARALGERVLHKRAAGGRKRGTTIASKTNRSNARAVTPEQSPSRLASRRVDSGRIWQVRGD
jgi:dihydroxyacid dehydratase/phosphogluconate dehydratase